VWRSFYRMRIGSDVWKGDRNGRGRRDCPFGRRWCL